MQEVVTTLPHKPLSHNPSSHTATQTTFSQPIITHRHTNQYHWLSTHHHTQPHKADHWLSTCHHTNHWFITHHIDTYHWLITHQHHTVTCPWLNASPSHRHTTGLFSSSSQKAHFSPTMKQTELQTTSVCLCHFQHLTGKCGGYHQGGPLQMHASCQQRWRDRPCSHGDGPRLQPADMDMSSMLSHLLLTTLTVSSSTSNHSYCLVIHF